LTTTFSSSLRVLVNFTTPLECLFSTEELSQTEEGQQTLFELEQHLSEAKNLFLDQRVASNVLEVMDRTLADIRDKFTASSDCPTSSAEEERLVTDCRSVASCVTLLRNILHIPDDDGVAKGTSSAESPKAASRQNQILWNLFSGNMDTVIINLIGNPCLSHW
jgi:hypothetical protein